MNNVIEMRSASDEDKCDKVIVTRAKLNELLDAKKEVTILKRENKLLREINRAMMHNVQR